MNFGLKIMRPIWVLHNAIVLKRIAHYAFIHVHTATQLSACIGKYKKGQKSRIYIKYYQGNYYYRYIQTYSLRF